MKDYTDEFGHWVGGQECQMQTYTGTKISLDTRLVDRSVKSKITQVQRLKFGHQVGGQERQIQTYAGTKMSLDTRLVDRSFKCKITQVLR